MDEESERKKLSDMGLTDDVIEIVLEKKRELLRKQTQQIIIQSEPQQLEPQQPEPQQQEPQQQESSSVIDEIPPPETPLVEIQQQQIIQKHLPIWKRRLQQRLNLSNHI